MSHFDEEWRVHRATRSANNYVNGVYKDEWKVLIKMNIHNEIWAETGRVIFNFRMSIYKMALILRHVLIIL